MKNIYTATKLLFILLIMFALLSGCSWRKPPGQNSPSNNIALDDVRADMSRKKQSVKLLNEPGMIHIQRHTKEYSISMVLDASDENIYFVMDLPQEEMEEGEEKAPEEVPEEEVVEETVPEEPPVEETAEVAEEEKTEPKPELDETRASKYVLYAQTYFLEKKYARALEEVRRALEYSPNSAVAHSLQGSIYFKLKEKDLAKAAWERALELDESLDNVKRMLDKLNKSS